MMFKKLQELYNGGNQRVIRVKTKAQFIKGQNACLEGASLTWMASRK
jgi:hypothetical protein